MPEIAAPLFPWGGPRRGCGFRRDLPQRAVTVHRASLAVCGFCSCDRYSPQSVGFLSLDSERYLYTYASQISFMIALEEFAEFYAHLAWQCYLKEKNGSSARTGRSSVLCTSVFLGGSERFKEKLLFLFYSAQPGASLEQTHIFVLAHILRRPIIVYGVKYYKSFRGETLGYTRFQGKPLLKCILYFRSLLL